MKSIINNFINSFSGNCTPSQVYTKEDLAAKFELEIPIKSYDEFIKFNNKIITDTEFEREVVSILFI